MLKATLRSVAGHKLRFVLTALSVVLGVAFVAGTFVLTDSIRNTFDGLVDQGTQGLSVMVRGTDSDNGRAPVPITLAEDLTAVDGVESAAPAVEGIAVLIGADGTAVRNGGAPTFGFSAADTPEAWTLLEGRLPETTGEVAVDSTALERSGLAVGDTTDVVAGQGLQEVRVVGNVGFGADATLAGATVVLFDEATALSLFAPDGLVPTISVEADAGVSEAELRGRVAAVLPEGSEAITGEALRAETSAEIEEALGFVSGFLLGFAAIALFVGAFIIVNTFTMLVAQRTKELALLRALGASRRQVTLSVLGEALVVGLVSSVVGLAVGVGLAFGIKELLGAFGLDIGSELPVAPRTVLASFAVGILVTLVSAWFPARRAAKVPPVAAMRDDVAMPERSLRIRAVAGVALALVGVGTLVGGLILGGTVSAALVGVGALATLLGVAVVAPVIAGPVVRGLASPYRRLFGTVGRLARDNALRNPRRTSSTAAALMIGMALVSGVTILASSARASTDSIIDNQVRADFVLSSGGSLPFPTSVADQVRDLDGVRSVGQLGFVPVSGDDLSTGATAIDAGDLQDALALEVSAGSVDSLAPGVVLIDSDVAQEQGWSVGDTVDLSVGTSAAAGYRIGAVFEPSPALGSALVVDRAAYVAGVPESARGDFLVYVRTEAGADQVAVRSALTDAVRPFAIVSVQDREEFKSSQADQVNTILYVIYGLLGLAVVIAVLGIVNTLALSVFERTREIGLLRAVGMDRRQLRRMVRLESVVIAVFGAVLGTAVGVFFGVALQRSLADDGLTDLVVPVGRLAAFLLAAGVVGVLAALWPARRAARLEVLKAITAQ